MRLVVVSILFPFLWALAAQAQESGLAAEVMDIAFPRGEAVVLMDVEVTNASASAGAITKIAIRTHPWVQTADPVSPSPPAGWRAERTSHLDASFTSKEGKGIGPGRSDVFRLRLVRPAQETLENLFQGGEEGKTLCRVTAAFAGGHTAVVDVPVPFLPELE